jgi:hypothetical protein
LDAELRAKSRAIKEVALRADGQNWSEEAENGVQNCLGEWMHLQQQFSSQLKSAEEFARAAAYRPRTRVSRVRNCTK